MTTAEQLLHELPESVAERVRPLLGGATVGGFVLYWLRTAQRAHDNPALDAALLAADALDLPVFVYHALSERYPYASDVTTASTSRARETCRPSCGTAAWALLSI